MSGVRIMICVSSVMCDSISDSESECGDDWRVGVRRRRRRRAKRMKTEISRMM